MTYSKAIVPLVLSQVLVLVHAQTLGISNVTCLPGFEWMLNSLGQNPCIVAGYLASECNGKPWTVDPIPPGQGPYNPPGTTSAASLCRCNVIDYNLVSGCSACQTGLVGTWKTWIQYCPSDLVTTGGKYPELVPAGTEIPTFAFWDTSSPEVGIFSPTGAKQYQDDHTSNGSGNHTGVIVGGVIGGVIGLALLAFAFALVISERFREKVGITKRPATPGAPVGGTTTTTTDFPGPPEKGNPSYSSLPLMGSAGDPEGYPTSETAQSVPGTPQTAGGFHLPQRFVRTGAAETYSGVQTN